MKMRTTVLIGASVFAQYELPEKTANKLRDKVWGLENNTNLTSIFCLIKSSDIIFIFLSAF